MQQEPKCTHTNEELILRVKDWIINLAKSGGKAWTLQIPANVNEDPDLLIGELITRFKALLKPGGQSAGTWVKASERLPAEFGDSVIVKNTENGKCKLCQNLGHRAGWDVALDRDFQYYNTVWLDEDTLPDNKDRDIAFVKWLGENCNYWPKSEEGAMNSKTYSLEQLHEIWQQSLNKTT